MSRHTEALKANGQEHILADWHSLAEEERESLDKQLDGIEFSRVASIFETSMELFNSSTTAKIEPLPLDHVRPVGKSNAERQAEVQAYSQAGMELLSRGKGAVVVLAGGQGTRLGVAVPKGAVEPGLPSGRSLFELHVRKVRRVELVSGGKILFMVLTSDATDSDTRQYFAKNDNFGLDQSQVVFFKQGSLPCLTEEGKAIMQSKASIASAPNGNAGFYSALAGQPIALLRELGIEYIQVSTVDNILCRMADPVFFGMCVQHKLDAAAKTTPKAYALEPVGVFTQRDGNVGVTEYTEIGQERAETRLPSGDLVYNLSNICIHCYSLPFLAQCVEKMETFNVYHVAKKQIPLLDGSKVPGIKLEAFIFDLFQFAESFMVLQVDRDVEFSPIKNADTASKDTCKTAREAVDRLHRGWLTAAGITVKDDASASAENKPAESLVEIDPLLSYGGEDLDKVKSMFGETILASHITLEKGKL